MYLSLRSSGKRSPMHRIWNEIHLLVHVRRRIFVPGASAPAGAE